MIKYNDSKNPHYRCEHGIKYTQCAKTKTCRECMEYHYCDLPRLHRTYKDAYEQALRDVEKQVKRFSGWICPNCGPLDGHEVTYEETCEHCGSEVK